MGLTMRERQAIIRELAPKFQQTDSKKERSQILDQCVSITGYTRAYAGYALRLCGKQLVRMIGGRRVIFVPGHGRSPGASRKRTAQYASPLLLEALTFFWALSDGLCGKRLVAFIGQTLVALERDGALPWLDKDPGLRVQLLRISSATIDRLLAQTKARMQLKGRSTTRPGTLLKYHIPVRTFSDWNENEPGFCEADLVAHDGGSPCGDFIQSLNLVDIATSWTEPIAVQNKAQCHVFAGLQQVRQRLPFALLGLDSDNGGEFINHQLVRYCDAEKISFTRSRPYRKNDNCFVEQKNYSIIRRTVAYYRYDTAEQLQLLNELYDALRLYVNFFQPVMKLTEKIRTGSHLTRHYDSPRTPYQRILEHPKVGQEVKVALQHQYAQLHLVELKRVLNRLQARLFDSAIGRKLPIVRPIYPPENHAWRRSNIAMGCRKAPLPLSPTLSGTSTKDIPANIQTQQLDSNR
jgi:hypothetical protein